MNNQLRGERERERERSFINYKEFKALLILQSYASLTELPKQT